MDWKRQVREGALMVAGTVVMALSLVVFTIPNDIAPGGVSGLATALAAIIPVPVGTLSLLLNVPLFLAALRMMGWRPLVKTAIPTVLLSVCIDLFQLFVPGYTNNVLLAAVMGGVGSGVGLGLLFLCGASSGGTDLLSLLVSRKLPNVSLGNLMLVIDASVVVFAVFVFRNIDVALYSGLAIFIASKVIDSVLAGADYAKVIYVVTEKGGAVLEVLNQKTERGVTVLPAQGGYTGKEKQMIMTVTRRNALSQTLRLIKLTDPQAFLFVMDAAEVHGEGFKSMEVEQ
ncbi:MAG: YitT family protein [Oscillospiraceae bacterium]